MRIKKDVEFKNIKILLLDDNKEFTNMVRDILYDDGYDCLSSNNPKEAIDILKEENIDILIVDYLMVGLTAIQIIEEVRKFNTDIYIILLTGHSNLMSEVFAIDNYDIQSYCEKGSDLETLKLKVKIACKQILKQKHIWDRKSLGERLKDCRNNLNLTQDQVAHSLGIQRSTVANYESDRNEPSLIQLRKLKKLFGVTYEYLMNDKEDCNN